MSYDQITIQGHTFKVPNRYSAGHTLTENEAAALNQTFHENLRNNFAKKVSEGVEAGLTIEALQTQLDDYAEEYQFGVRTGGGRSGDPVTTLAMNAAREIIRTAIKSNKDIDPDKWPASRVTQAARALLEQQGDDGPIITNARKTVQAEKIAAKEAVDAVAELLSAQAAE